MTAHRSGLLRVWIGRTFAVLPMTMWLSLLLLSSAWTRPIGETVWVWVCSLPVFLLLDFVRHKAAPERNAYLAWLGLALAAARRGEATPPMAGRFRRLVAWYGPLALLVAYIAAFIFEPAVRGPAEAMSQVPAIGWVYRVFGAWYPTAAREPVHILALGHPRDADDLRHFLTVVLVFSLSATAVAAGPGRREFVEWRLLRPIRSAMKRRGRELSNRKLFRIALGATLLGGCGLAMFAVAGTGDIGSPVYWGLDAFRPCVVFTLFGYILAAAIAYFCALEDAVSAQRDLPLHKISP